MRLDGELTVPGDKSIAHRAVLLAALSLGECELRGMPDGDDVQRTLAAVVALGIRAERRNGVWHLHGAGMHGLRPASGAIDCGNSGTTMRLLAGLLTGQPFASLLVGDASLSRRPMRRVAEPLQLMGARLECLGPDFRPPLRITAPRAGRLEGRSHRLAVDSAQVRAAILLAGVQASGPTRIEPAGASRDHTERMLRALGVHVQRENGALEMHPTRPEGWRAFDFWIPGDVSSAAFAIGLAVATPGARLRVRRVGLNPGRARYLDILREAGAPIEVRIAGEERGEPWGDLLVRGGELRAFQLRGDDVVACLDEIPALFATAAIAGCPAAVRDAEELRVKESDRIAGLAEVLTAFGARVREKPDGLVLSPGTVLRPAHVRSHGDHRLAMAAAMLALRAPGTSEVQDVDCVRTSYPEFAAQLSRLSRREAGATRPSSNRRPRRRTSRGRS